MAQLVEQSLSTSKVHGSNPVIGKLLYRTFVYCQLCWKDEKEAENGTFTKTSVWKTMMQKWGVKISTHFWWNILRRSVHVLPSRRNLATCHRAWEQNWTELNRHLLKRKILFFLSKISEKGSKIWIKVNFSICGESLRAVTFSMKFIVFGFMWFLLQYGAGRRHSSPQSLSKNVILQKMWFWNCQMLFLKALVCTLKCWKVFSENIF